MPIDIIYQDEYIVAVNKPQALLSVPGLGPDKQDCMIS
ncbi:MAG: RNA pseudouridine synthase, partial [Gammaproteobacteria bacterium]|nr:RNA pseudouridine synthase [Gammaproteobacteria bacterium]